MGKLTIAEVEELVKKKTLSPSAAKTMEEKGLVGTRKRGSKRFLKNGKNGTKIYPQLYFSGLGKGNTYTNDMVEIKKEFATLINKYTTVKGEENND